MTYYELIKDAEHKLNSNKITLGEYEEMIKPLKQEIEQQPCEDWYDVPSDEMTLEQARQAVKDLRKKLAEYLEQQPTPRNNLAESSQDCISRQEALKCSHIEYDDDGVGHRVIYAEDLEKLSPVTPTEDSEDKYELGYNCGYADAMNDIAESEE